MLNQRGVPSILIKGTTRVGPAYALFGFFGWLTSREASEGPFGKHTNLTDAWVLVEQFSRHERWDWDSEEAKALREFVAWLGTQEESLGPFSKHDATDALNYNLFQWCHHKGYDLGSDSEAFAATQDLQPYPD